MNMPVLNMQKHEQDPRQNVLYYTSKLYIFSIL